MQETKVQTLYTSGKAISLYELLKKTIVQFIDDLELNDEVVINGENYIDLIPEAYNSLLAFTDEISKIMSPLFHDKTHITCHHIAKMLYYEKIINPSELTSQVMIPERKNELTEVL